MLATDPDPLVQHGDGELQPAGFPNDITDTATASVDVKRPVADITITKTADALSKVGDSVTYTFRICNVGDITVNRGSVTDTLLGDLTAFFPATLAPGQCAMVERTRRWQAGDPDPLVNTVTATYTARPGLLSRARTRRRPVPARTCSSPVSVSPRTARLIPSTWVGS